MYLTRKGKIIFRMIKMSRAYRYYVKSLYGKYGKIDLDNFIELRLNRYYAKHTMRYYRTFKDIIKEMYEFEYVMRSCKDIEMTKIADGLYLISHTVRRINGMINTFQYTVYYYRNYPNIQDDYSAFVEDRTSGMIYVYIYDGGTLNYTIYNGMRDYIKYKNFYEYSKEQYDVLDAYFNIIRKDL